MGAREVAQGQADQQGEHRAHQGQRQGYREPGGQQLRHRHRVGEGVAEVQGKDLLEEEEILGEQRLVQAQLFRQGGDGLLRGLLAQDQAGGLARDKADDGEHQDGDHKQHRDHLQDPLEDVIESIQRETPASVSSGRPLGAARFYRLERPERGTGGWSGGSIPPSSVCHTVRADGGRPAQLALVQFMAWYT